MIRLLTAILAIWERRYYLLVPIVLVPAIALLWSINRTQVYETSVTLNINNQRADSPLLKHASNSGNVEILTKLLNNSRVLAEPLSEHNLINEEMTAEERNLVTMKLSNQLQLDVINDEMLTITYKNSDKQNMESIIESVALNFIDEVLTPERLRLQHTMTSLGNQIKHYQTKEKDLTQQLKEFNSQINTNNTQKIVELEFNLKRSRVQYQIAQEEYAKLLSKASILTSHIDGRITNSILWFVEKPIEVISTITIANHIQIIINGIIAGLILSLFSIIATYFGDRTVRSDNDIKHIPNLKVISHTPNFGNLDTHKDIINVKAS